MDERERTSLIVRLSVLTLARLFLNTALRFVYPFAPALARGLSVSLAEIYYLITLRNATGFLSPIFGPLSENFGRRVIMIGSILLFAGGCLIVVVWPTYIVLGLSLVIIGLAKVIFDPAMQAFVGDTVPYHQRGRAISVTEYSWALSLLIGAPFVGMLIRNQGWQAPFQWLGIFAIGAVIFLALLIPKSGSNRHQQLEPLSTITIMRQNPVVLFASVYMVLVMTANEMLFIVFGGWLEDSFQLSLTNLGLAAAIIGGAELLGESMAGLSVDRFGKRPVIIIAGLLNAFSYLVLPFVGFSLVLVLTALAFLFIFFEITVVGGVPLMTELVPKSRAVVMSVLIAAMMLGRTLGAFIGPLVWDKIGIYGTGVVSSLIMLIAIFILFRWVREGN